MKVEELVPGGIYIYPAIQIRVAVTGFKDFSPVLTPLNSIHDIGGGAGMPVLATPENTEHLVPSGIHTLIK